MRQITSLARLVNIVLLLALAGSSVWPILAARAQSGDPFAGWQTYTDNECLFSIRYPPDSINRGRIDSVINPGQPVIRIDLPIIPNTNLSEKYVEIICSADSDSLKLNMPYAQSHPSINFNGVDFELQSGHDGGAGHFHDVSKYSTIKDNRYLSLNFILHSVSPYASNLPEFDNAIETKVFEQILSTFTSSSKNTLSTQTLPGVVWNTFLGSAEKATSNDDMGDGITLDEDGNSYITGRYCRKSHGSTGCAFVAKLDNAGRLIWNTALGEIYQEGYLYYAESASTAVALDKAGDIYVIGYSYRAWGKPVNSPTEGAGQDAFVAKLNGEDGALVWNTLLGASGDDDCKGITLDLNGNLFVVGKSKATWGNPVRAHSKSSGSDAFVARLNSENGELIWNTFLGGEESINWQDDNGAAITVDSSGNIYVLGNSFPAWGEPINPHSVVGKDSLIGSDAFVAKLDSNGNLEWNTFVGGNDSFEKAKGIVTNENGEIYIAGESVGESWGKPVNTSAMVGDAFVAKLTNSGTLIWNTSLGGSFGEDITLDTKGDVYIVGDGCRDWGNPVNHHEEGACDVYAAKLNSEGALLWNTFLGGKDIDDGYTTDGGEGIAVDRDGYVYITGFSRTSWGTPVNAHPGGRNIFVAKLVVEERPNIPISEPPVETEPVQPPVEPTPEPTTSCPGLPIDEDKQEVIIEGHVQGGTNETILRDVLVQLVDDASAQAVCSDYTDDNGNYSIVGAVPPAAYHLQVWLKDSQDRRQVLYGPNQLQVWLRKAIRTTAEQNTYQQDMVFCFSAGCASPMDYGAPNGFEASLPEIDLLDDLATIYVDISDVKRYVNQELGYSSYHHPKSIWAWSSKTSQYDSAVEQVIITSGVDLWVERHETFHHLMYQFAPTSIDQALFPDPVLHGGWANPDTRDSWVEGWAVYWACQMGKTSFISSIIFDNIELQYKSWDVGIYSKYLSVPQIAFIPAFNPAYFPRENMAVAGVLWDLTDPYDSAEPEDTIEMRPVDLFKTVSELGVQKEKNGNQTRQSIVTMYDVYTWLKQKAQQSQLNDVNGAPISTPDLNRIFIAHGFFADAEWDHPFLYLVATQVRLPDNTAGWRRWWAGEEVGPGGKPGRYSMPLFPNAYVQIDLANRETLPDQNGTVWVQILHTKSYYDFSYKTDFTSLPTRVYVDPQPDDLMTLIKVQVFNSRGSSEQYTINNLDYLNDVSVATQGYARDVVLAPGSEQKPISGLSIARHAVVQLGESADFSGTATFGTDVAYSWNFGDGTSSSGLFVSHAYQSPGVYTVTLTASNSLGAAVAAAPVKVIEPPAVSPWQQFQNSFTTYRTAWIAGSAAALGGLFLTLLLLRVQGRKPAKPSSEKSPRGVKQPPPGAEKPLHTAQLEPASIKINSASPQPQRPHLEPVPAEPVAPLPAQTPAPVTTAPPPRMLAALRQQGIQQVKAGDHASGMAALQQVLQHSPNDGEAWLWLGFAAAQKKDWRTAERCMLRAEKIGHPQASQALEWMKKQQNQ